MRGMPPKLSAPDQPGPEFVRFFAVDRELLLPVFFLCRGIEERRLVFRVIVKENRIGDPERFAGPEDPGHRQLGYLSVSRPVSMDEVRAWPFHERLVQNTVGMMSPVL